MVSGIILFKGSLEQTDYPRLDAIKAEFDLSYENEKKKKEFDKYYVLNKYAKQKKRRRNYSIDRSHHYEKILEESTEKVGSGFKKQILLVLCLSFVVFMCFQVKKKMEEPETNFVELVVSKKEENDANLKGKDKKKKNK